MLVRENELKHYGILGMKWGVRRYQNEDGSLTPAGLKRYEKVANSKIRQLEDTINAKSIYKRGARDLKTISDMNKDVAYRTLKKYNKVMSNKKLDETKRSEKSKKLASRYNSAMYSAIAFSRESDIMKKKYSDIKSGKMKAGRDFVIETTVDWHADVFGAGHLVTRRVVEKRQ